MNRKKFDRLEEQLDKFLQEMKDDYFKEYIEESIPKGWVNIEEYLPQCLGGDFVTKGYSSYKVLDKDGNEFESKVNDSKIWYYKAKESGITHWWNE